MSLMFGAEKLMKSTKNNFLTLTASSDSALKEAINSGGLEKILAQTAQKFKGLSKNGQTAAKVGLGLLFVAGSIGAYGIGKTVGKKLSGRDE